MKTLHFGDVHLHNGHLYEEIVKCCLYILARAREERPDLIIIPGDIFDLYRDNCGLRIGTPATLFAADFLRCLAEIAPVVIITGTLSHDPQHAIEIFTRLHTECPVRTVTSLEQIGIVEGKFVSINSNNIQEYVESGLLMAVISCLPSVTKASVIAQLNLSGIDEGNRATEELVRDVFQAWGVTNGIARQSGVPAIFAGHCTVKGSVTSTGQKMIGKELEFGVADLKLTNCDIYCLNHIHKAQKINSNIFYSGSITRLDHGETEHKGVFFHEFSREGAIESRFVETPARVMKTVSATDGGLPDDSLLEGIQKGDIVRIRFTVREDELPKVDEQALKKAAIARGAIDVTFDKDIVPIQRVRSEGISKLRTLHEKLTAWGVNAGENITDSLKEKLDLLLSMEPDRILQAYSNDGKEAKNDTERLVA